MTYANSWKRANGATVQIGATTHEDATVIGVPGDQVELIEKTSLGASRREWDASDMVDSPELTVTVPNGATTPTVGTSYTVVVTLPKVGSGRTYTFTGLVVSVLPSAAEVDGMLGIDITIKPTSAAVIA